MSDAMDGSEVMAGHQPGVMVVIAVARGVLGVHFEADGPYDENEDEDEDEGEDKVVVRLFGAVHCV